MAKKLKEIICFRGDRLFNGAVNISWYGTDETKTKAASEAFVFHGPKYHGIQQEDVGDIHGHKLIDTANLAQAVLRRCYGIEDQPFTLAIAGYGTGKSHFGLTLASLLSNPEDKNAQSILSALKTADADIGDNIKILLKEANQPCLVVALNGMQSFDLTAELSKHIIRTLKKDGHDTKSLDDLRPRFGQAINLIRFSNDEVLKELVTEADVDSVESIIEELEQQDEITYGIVHSYFSKKGMSIRVLSGESVKDVIDITVKEYCGDGKPYRSLLVLFDEFGKYTEFATVKSQIAGNGALQNLFEAIQSNSQNACFVGFIQFELNTYVQRIAPEYKNEILRYVTRYQSANKLYLSINLETLIASLMEKRDVKLLDNMFDNEKSKHESREIMTRLSQWFPQSNNHRLWGDESQFHTVIRKGCWPLSPYSTWLLFCLASAGKHLQERSALALLGDAFQRHDMIEIAEKEDWALSPSDLWSEVLEQELISSEEIGQQGSITHAYSSVIAKHGAQISKEQRKILQAIVLASKLGLVVVDNKEAINAISSLSGLPIKVVDAGLKILQEEYNVIEWDAAFNSYDILGDAVPRTQFLAFIRSRVASSYDENGKSILFASRAIEWCARISDIDCDFSEENKIRTREWRYIAVATNLELLPSQIKIASDRWASATEVDNARGTIIYTYIGQNNNSADASKSASKYLRDSAREKGYKALPIIVVIIHDNSGILGQSLAEYAVLEDISETEIGQFGNLVGAHKEKLVKNINEHIDALLMQRMYVTALSQKDESQRLSQLGTELFSKIYKKPLQFPFDGFSTSRGNAADTCHEFTRELLHGTLDYDTVLAKPQKSKNRAITVLNNVWGIYKSDGYVTRSPKNAVVNEIISTWDDIINKKQKLPILDVIKQICLPPYGANIASAGLLFGTYIAPRYNDLIVMKNGQQTEILQWMQDDIFKGKYLNLSALQDVLILKKGESSTEWETLLDEWEQSDSYLSQIRCYKRSVSLKEHTALPHALAFREEKLREKAIAAMAAIEKMEKEQDSALMKIEDGLEKGDVSLLTWGVVKVKNICDTMSDENQSWTESQLAQIQPHYENGRQKIIQLFPEWITRQAPKSDLPVDVGDFKHKMLKLVCNNLKILGLEEESQALELHTMNVIKHAEDIARAKQLLRDVESWLIMHADSEKVGKLAEIRESMRIGKEFTSKLQGIARVVKIPQIPQIRSELSEFMKKLKNMDTSIVKRVSDLPKTNICNEDDLDKLLSEVDSLIYIFDNVSAVINPLQNARRALRMYKSYYQRLSDENLTWNNMNKLSDEMRKECKDSIESEGLPWSHDEVADAFVKDITLKREERSHEWMCSMEESIVGIAKMEAAEVNRVYSQLTNPPAIVTESHKKELSGILKIVSQRLSELNIEWLVEKFKELTSKNKEEFLRIAKSIISNSE